MSLYNRILKAIGLRQKAETSDDTQQVEFVHDPKPGKYFMLGLDFGTHGTKVAYRDIDANYNAIRIITLSESGTEDRDRYVIPSLISADNGLLYFGRKLDGARVIENFKSRIGECIQEDFTGFTFEELSALFITSLVCRAGSKIRSENPSYNCKIMLHLGAPFGTFEGGADGRKEAYDEILKLVWRGFRIEEYRMNWELSMEEVKQMLQRWEALQSLDEETWRWLVPEVQAVFTSYAQHTRPPTIADHHFLIDVGGFTIDVCLFSLGNPDNPRTAIDSTDVIYIALNDFDNATDKPTFIVELRRKILKTIEQGIEHMCPSTLPRNDLYTHRKRFYHETTKKLWLIGGGRLRPDLCNRLFDQRCFLSGWDHLDRDPKLWEKNPFIIVVKGLATRHEELIEIVKSRPFQPAPPPNDTDWDYHLTDHR